MFNKMQYAGVVRYKFFLVSVHVVLTLDCGSTLLPPPLCDRRRRYSKIREEMLDRRRGDRPRPLLALIGDHPIMTSAKFWDFWTSSSLATVPITQLISTIVMFWVNPLSPLSADVIYGWSLEVPSVLCGRPRATLGGRGRRRKESWIG